MAKVIQTMQYDILEEKRAEYLAVVAQLRAHYATNPYVEYTVYELKGKKNSFFEMFLAHSEDAFKKFQESDDEKADDLASTLAQFVSGKSKYTTHIEAA